jgi:hypothetical protein
MMKIQRFKIFEAIEQNNMPDLYDMIMMDIDLEDLSQYFVELEDIGATIEYGLKRTNGWTTYKFTRGEKNDLDNIAEIVKCYFDSKPNRGCYLDIEISMDLMKRSFGNDFVANDLDEHIYYTRQSLITITRLKKIFNCDWSGPKSEQLIRIHLKPTAANLEEKKQIARTILNSKLEENTGVILKKTLNSINSDIIFGIFDSLEPFRKGDWGNKTVDLANFVVFETKYWYRGKVFNIPKPTLTLYINKLKKNLPKFVTVTRLEGKDLEDYKKEEKIDADIAVIKIEIEKDNIGIALQETLSDDLKKALELVT